jgi:hypothetical protein
MEITIKGIQALQLAREISKVPGLSFTVAFFPYSRIRNQATPELDVRQGCVYRAQLPHEEFSIDGENFFLFIDGNGQPRMCYRYLIRYMGFPQDKYKLHKINWL